MTNVKKVDFMSPYKQLRLVIEPIQPKTQWSPGKSGKHVQFENGMYSTTDSNIIDWIRKHASYGIRIFEDKGIPAPKLSPELMDKISSLSETQMKALLERLRTEEPVAATAPEAASEESAPAKKPVGRPPKPTVVADI